MGQKWNSFSQIKRKLQKSLLQLFLFDMQNDLPIDIVELYSKYSNEKTIMENTTLYGQNFSIPGSFKILQFIGSGAYGAVVAAKDYSLHENHENRMVAIKKMSNVFGHKFSAKRILRELKMLRLLNHPNIISLSKIILPKSRAQFSDIYGVFELMDTDLHQLIYGNEGLNSNHRILLLYQALRALSYMHSNNVVHRDLKPRNILINQKCDLKLADFGFARRIGDVINPNLTQYVATRWYRAPQLLLQNSVYSTAVDIWSIGCIHAEMILRKVLLMGMSTRDQFEKMSEEIGMPDEQKFSEYPESVRDVIKLLMKKKKNTSIFQRLKDKISDQELDILKKMLQFFPNDRITAQQALKHPFFSQIHEEEETIEKHQIPQLQFQFENHNLNTEQLKDLLYEQALLYHYDDFVQAHRQKIQKKQSLIQHILNNSNSKKYNPVTDDEGQSWREKEVKIQNDE